MSLAPAKFAWLDREFVPWQDAKIHVRSECVTRGICVFEGLRGYWNEHRKQMYVFRVPEHFRRLEDSMKVLRLPLPYSLDIVKEGMLELVRRCELREDAHGEGPSMRNGRMGVTALSGAEVAAGDARRWVPFGAAGWCWSPAPARTCFMARSTNIDATRF